ncbi:hypothetical protein KSF73_02225 [Burkholderiaceae bacterium DAT-1]|nr:hypothetical protein [Burkholderiaceae bacterium DAT-1]
MLIVAIHLSARGESATYSLEVRDVPLREVLTALAADSGMELQIQTGSDARLTLLLKNRPLATLLEAIALQTGLLIEIRDKRILVNDDVPTLHTYRVDYPQIARQMKGHVSLSTAVGTTGSAQANAPQTGNSSETDLTSASDQQFWGRLEKAIATLLQPAAPLQGDASAPVPRFVLHPESGVIAAWLKRGEHLALTTFLNDINLQSHRQILIDAALVELELKEEFSAGVNWSVLLGGKRLEFGQSSLGSRLSTEPFGLARYLSGDLNGVLKLLESVGSARVLSNPRIMALNNQSAVLKVVDEKVYFSTQIDIREATERTPERRVYSSTVHTVPVGFVMTVLPQISAHGDLILHIRPTISRITGYRDDPAIAMLQADGLAAQSIRNPVPEIQVREIESLLTLADGETAVLGGLVQQQRDHDLDRVPGSQTFPFGLDRLFGSQSRLARRTELLIVLRAHIKAAESRWPDALPEEVR